MDTFILRFQNWGPIKNASVVVDESTGSFERGVWLDRRCINDACRRSLSRKEQVTPASDFLALLLSYSGMALHVSSTCGRRRLRWSNTRDMRNCNAMRIRRCSRPSSFNMGAHSLERTDISASFCACDLVSCLSLYVCLLFFYRPFDLCDFLFAPSLLLHLHRGFPRKRV